ncbi:MAG TPA: 50S ribosomal protein L6 [Candidatus Sumerlaeota bacterium]|nr:50S ribosomal protein L6 [Candidatus Sumerlaeota bacterium]HPK02563.1 50S ribosomal protein L6 [Candidatus Sumerlaeota bacterium]
MSRIGKIPITLPRGAEARIDGNVLTVKGPKGSLSLDFHNHVKVRLEDGALLVERHSDERQDRAYHGLYQRLIRNMVTGVAEGFAKQLELVGVGYRATMDGKTLVMNLGFSHEVRFGPIDGVTLAVPDPTHVTVNGIDKQLVGQVAANIRRIRPPEPYKGKGIRYSGEHIRRKVGKAGV